MGADRKGHVENSLRPCFLQPAVQAHNDPIFNRSPQREVPFNEWLRPQTVLIVPSQQIDSEDNIQVSHNESNPFRLLKTEPPHQVRSGDERDPRSPLLPCERPQAHRRTRVDELFLHVEQCNEHDHLTSH